MSVITAKDLYSLNQENLIKPSDEGWWDITSNEYNTYKNKYLYNKSYITCAFLIKLHVEEDLDDSAWDYYVLYYGNLGDTFDTNTSGSYYDGSSYYAIYEVYMKPTIRAWKYDSAIPSLPTANESTSLYTKNQIKQGKKFSYNVFLFGCKWLDRSSDNYIADYSLSYGFILPKQNSYVIFKIDSEYYIFKLSKEQPYWATLEDGITIVGFWSQLETSEQYSLNKISDQLYSYLERNYKITFYNSQNSGTQLVVKTKNNSKYLFYAKPSDISDYEESFSTDSLIEALDGPQNKSDLFNDNMLGDTSYQAFIAFRSDMECFYSTEYISSEIYPDNLSQLKCFYTIESTPDNEYFSLAGDAYFKQGETGFLCNGSIVRKIKSLSEITLSSYTIKKQSPYFQKELLFTDLSSSQQQQAFPTKIWPYKKVSDGVYKSRQGDKDNSSCIIGPYTNFYLYSNEIKLPLYHKITGSSKIYNQLTDNYSDVEKTSYTTLYSDSIYSSCVPCYKWKEQYLKYFGSQSQDNYSFDYKYKDSKKFINLTTNNPKYLGLTSLSCLDGQVYKKPKEDASYSGSDRSLTIVKENNIITITEEDDLNRTSYTINSDNEKIIIAIKSSEYTKDMLTGIYNSNIPAATFPTTIEEYQNKYFGAYSCWDSTIYKHRTYNWQAYRQNSPSWATHKYSLWSGNSLMDVPSFSWTLDANESLSNLLGLYVNSYYNFYELIPEELKSNQTLYLGANSTIPDYLKKITDTNDINNYKKAFGIQTKIYEGNTKLDFETVKVPSTSKPAFEKTWSDSGDYRFYVPNTNLYLSGQIEYTDIEPNYNTSVTAKINKNMTSSTQDFSILDYWFNIKFNLVAMPMRRISLVNPYVDYTSTSPNTKPIWERSNDFYVGSKGACLNRPYGVNISTPIRNTGFNIGINFDDSTISSQDFMPNQRCPWGLLSVLK